MIPFRFLGGAQIARPIPECQPENPPIGHFLSAVSGYRGWQAKIFPSPCGRGKGGGVSRQQARTNRRLQVATPLAVIGGRSENEVAGYAPSTLRALPRAAPPPSPSRKGEGKKKQHTR